MNNSSSRPFWMPDAQGFVAGSVILMAAVALFYRMGHPSTVDDKILDMMLTILYGTAFVAIVNFLFGSSRSSQNKDDTLATLATAPSIASPPPPVVVPWWGRLTDAEKTVIIAQAASDPRVAAFVNASQVGAAAADDLTYLVSKGLLSQDRSIAIQTA